MSTADPIKGMLKAWREEHGWQRGNAWDPHALAYVQAPGAELASADHVAAALEQCWYCELCEQMHPVGAHVEPGAAWPPAPPQVPRPRADRVRHCLCGLYLFSTEKTANPEAWARHLAHMAEFQRQAQQEIDEAIRRHRPRSLGFPREHLGPCARCRQSCQRYGDSGQPLCDDCQETTS